MNAQQITLFENAVGVSVSQLTLVIASIAAVVYVLWGAWLAYGQLQRWQTGESSGYEVLTLLVRMAVMLMFLGYWLR